MDTVSHSVGYLTKWLLQFRACSLVKGKFTLNTLSALSHERSWAHETLLEELWKIWTILFDNYCGVIGYNWRERLIYCSLDLREINEGIQRANMINERCMERQQQAKDIPQPELVNENSEILAITSNIPRIRMRETDTNCWEVVLNEEERQLIDEFLQE